jgi:hypothetical protein
MGTEWVKVRLVRKVIEQEVLFPNMQNVQLTGDSKGVRMSGISRSHNR